MEAEPTDWLETTLGEFSTLQRGIDLPAGQRKFGRVPVLGSFGVTGWHDEARAPGPGVTVGRSGASYGVVSYSEVAFWPLNTALYVRHFHGNDPRFAYYFLRTFPFKKFNSGSAQPSLNRNFVHPTPIRVPRPEEQRRIAGLLGALDDKIELNLQMNRTLEAMAQALFKSWFIDFDGLNDFVDSELGKIPRGWTIVRLGEVCSKIGSGATPRGGSEVYVSAGPAFVRSQNVHDFAFDWGGLVRLSPGDAERLKGVELQPNDVLINITGDSILRTCVVDPAVLPATVNQHVAIIRPKPPVSGPVVHLQLLHARMKEWLLGHSAGATRKAITKGHLERVPILLPPPAVLTTICRTLSPIYDRHAANSAQSRTLAGIRDALLPKLISGEIRCT